MKHIRIIILLSLFFGFSSVYAQSTNIATEKSEPEKITVQTDSENNVGNQPQTLNAAEVTPATQKVSTQTPQNQKEKKVFVKTGPTPADVNTSQPQQTKSNSNTVTSAANKSKPLYTPANPDPKKK